MHADTPAGSNNPTCCRNTVDLNDVRAWPTHTYDDANHEITLHSAIDVQAIRTISTVTRTQRYNGGRTRTILTPICAACTAGTESRQHCRQSSAHAIHSVQGVLLIISRSHPYKTSVLRHWTNWKRIRALRTGGVHLPVLADEVGQV